MARLAANNLSATTNVTLYTVPSNRRAVFTVSLCNRTAAPIAVRLALQSGTLTDADYLEYEAVVPASGVLERSGLMLTGGQVCMARASAVGVSAVVFGLEEQV